MKLVVRRNRRAISPFLATIILVVITLMIGGILYTQFRNIVVSQVKNPSMDLTSSNVAPNGETIVLSLKNDGNVPITLSKMLVSYNAGLNTFSFVVEPGQHHAGVLPVRHLPHEPRGHPHGADDHHLPHTPVLHVHGDCCGRPALQGLQRPGVTLKRSPAFSTYVAAIVLIVITMSLSFVVYQGVKGFAPQKQDQDVTFVNRVVTLPEQEG